MEKETILSCRAISKAFGPTRALVDVDMDVRAGDVRGLIGENGSGKSTLSSIFAGAQQADSGEMFLRGKPFQPKTMAQAQNAGISMILQEMGTLPGITVAYNIFVGHLGEFTRGGILNVRKLNAKANEILDEIGAGDIRAEMNVDELNFEDRKIVEVARAMYFKPKVLIIDETTTALAQKGRTILYRLIRRMSEENRAVIFISHDLDELMEVCTSITVLRDGHRIDTLEVDRISVANMRLLMVGRELQGNYYRADYDQPVSPEVVLRAHQITVGKSIRNVSLELHKGEILGIGGLADSGMHELGKAVMGIEKVITGYVELPQKGIRLRAASTALRQKLGYISKDRDKEALILQASIRDNICMGAFRILEKFGIITDRSQKALAAKEADLLKIKCASTSQSCTELSGGNKQKVVVGKWLANDSEILIMDCPTRGIDVGVKASIYNLMYELKQQGKSILMISEELPELIGMSDRMLFLKDGRITAELNRAPDITEHMVIPYMI